jgi:hypothetical protein
LNIIEQIARDGRYKSICIGLAKRPHLADDLLQEFHLAICEIGENELNDVRDKGFLEVYCVGIINNIWNKYNSKITIKKNANGKTSPFFEYSKFAVENPVYVSSGSYDYKVDYIYKKAKEIIEQDTVSKDKDLMYKSRTFAYALNYKINVDNGKIQDGGMFKNARDLAIKMGGEYHTVYKAVKNYQKRLKEILNKYKND